MIVIDLFGKITKIAAKQEMIFNLARRAQSDLHESRKLRLCSSAAFGEVCSNGSAGPSQLARQAEQFSTRKALSCAINVKRQHDESFAKQLAS